MAAPSESPRSSLADADIYKPTYHPAELQVALVAERTAEANAAAAIERKVGELEASASAAGEDQLHIARADLAVRRRFIAALEACQTAGLACPPRLDDPPWTYDVDPDVRSEPPVTATLRFDLDSWRSLADELHGRACACRTIACVDSLGVAIDQLETRPMPQVRGDDAATLSITRARECLFRLRGKSTIPVHHAVDSDAM